MFHYFKTSISNIPLPELFTYPFNYEPHTLCVIASKELQEFLLNQTEWEHDFGIHHFVEGTNVGKMFGVLVVTNSANELGYLCAFSGKVAGTQNLRGFVPPIVNILDENGFYRIGENEIIEINKQIAILENNRDYEQSIQKVKSIENESIIQLQLYKDAMKIAKKERDAKRLQLNKDNSDYESTCKLLENESIRWHYDYKKLTVDFKHAIESAEKERNAFRNAIQQLKELRKEKSAALQQKLFDAYMFYNARGEIKNVNRIFTDFGIEIPPSGAGECAAPKLLQYAYLHNYTPIAMAEFWWGQSPNSEIRKHKVFYPSCKSKCEPILHFMLQGLKVEPNPLTQKINAFHDIPVIYEDEWIVVVNKPADMLSVPGKTESNSAFSILEKKYGQIFVVHRLDMSTSGLLIFAKNPDIQESLHRQFENRQVTKRYVALLQGTVKEDSGIIELPIRVDLDNRPRQLVCFTYGKPSVTKWQVIERKNNTIRMYFYPETGRTHQLRVHAAHRLGLHCPIIGDDLYGERANRLHLHAEYIEFFHPISKHRIHFEVEAEF